MSQLFLASDMDVLARRLLDEIAARQKSADLFEPISIVVPNRFVQQWLKFRMAREWGVAINLRFSFLEHALWDWLRELDPRPHDPPPELLDADRYHLLVLSILLGDNDPALAPLQAFFEKGTQLKSRHNCRRAWQLAGKLGSLIRDYEYHRQESIIQPWLSPVSEVDVPVLWRDREAAQRAVFRAVVDETAGRRAIWNRALKRNFKTLPQYVMEFVHEIKDYRAPAPRLIHLFGLSQISPLHLRALKLLGRYHDWRVYHLNPLVSRLRGAPKLGAVQKLAYMFRGDQHPDARTGTELLHIWVRAGAESLDLTAGFLRDPRFRATVLPCPKDQSRSVTILTRLHDLLLQSDDATLPTAKRPGAPSEGEHSSAYTKSPSLGASDFPSSAERLPQDVSLQIVRCPGIWREVETIHAGILNSLQKDRALQQTDIAVLVTDMDLYRPVLMAVFERPPRLLSFGLADYTAAHVSTYGQALLGMLDLALENLSRSRVFEVLLNPCVLARLNVDRESALHWLTWADNLGIHHGWDAAEKKDHGFAASSLFTWKLGLQRLRLGQFMNVVAEEGPQPAPQWLGVIPFADVESGDRERLDPFCRVVEGLLPMLVRLRGMTARASEWSEAIVSLMQRFLAVPENRPEEEPVRDALIESLHVFAECDTLPGTGANLPLALVREFIASHLQGIPGRRNDVFSSGITIAALKPQRPIAFKVIFLAGMGEAHFPGGASLSPFDLRQVHRQPGDILPMEQQRFAFLETILSARQKLVITFNGRDLQKDEDLQPAIAVAQLQRFLAKNVVQGDAFQVVDTPLLAHDVAYLDSGRFPVYQDVLVQERATDRVLSIDLAERSGQIATTPEQAECLRSVRGLVMPASGPVAAVASEMGTRAVSLPQLRRFLENPADAALRYHLRAKDEWTDDAEDDYEPLVSGKYIGLRLVECIWQDIVRRAETENLEELLRDWPRQFEAKYREWSLRGKLPEAPFAEVDANILRGEVSEGLNAGGLRSFLETRAGKTWSGPLLLGESATPVGARRRLPAAPLTMTRSLPHIHGLDIRLIGQWPFVWEDDATFDLLVFDAGKSDGKGLLDRKLFEPLLFIVALAALGELRGRRTVFYLVRTDGIEEVELDGTLTDPSVARAYLASLATDFLDPACADQLPFQLLRDDWAAVYQGDEDAALGARLLADWRQKEEDRYWCFNDSALLELQDIGFRVPDDVYVKVDRRLRPLGRAFAGANAETAEEAQGNGETTEESGGPMIETLDLAHHAVFEASAGTGKTYTIGQLAIRLLREQHCQLENLLVVTFTDKATGELKDRLRRALEDAIDKDLNGAAILRSQLDQFDRAAISTLHGFCQRLLQEHAADLGQDFQLSLAQDPRLRIEALREVMRKDWPEQFGARLPEVLAAAGYHRGSEAKWEKQLDQILRKYRPACGHLLIPEKLPPLTDEISMRQALLAFTVLRSCERLSQGKLRRGQMSFDDQIERVAAGLDPMWNPRANVVAEAVRRQYRFAIVDEFQDTDALQWAIFRRLFLEEGTSKLVVVGDPKQAIYGFRGADLPTYVQAVGEMRDRFNASVFALDTNWRSSPDLIAVLNHFFGDGAFFPVGRGINYSPVSAPPPDKRRAKLAKDDSRRAALTIVDVTGEPDSAASTARSNYARFIAAEVRRLLGEPPVLVIDDARGRRPLAANDICILVLKRSEVRDVASALARQRIPFSHYKNAGVGNTSEARDIRLVLKALAYPDQRRFVTRALLTMFFPIRPVELMAGADVAADHPARALFDHWRTLADRRQWSELCTSMLEESGVLFREQDNVDYDRRVANLKLLLGQLQDDGYRNNLDLYELLESFEGGDADEDENEDYQPQETDEPRVQIMTIHAAKGLEFPVVFLAGGFTNARFKEMAYRDDAGRLTFDVSFIQEEKRNAKDARLARIEDDRSDETRRLLYVALTRAQFKLYVPLMGGKKRQADKSAITAHITPAIERCKFPLDLATRMAPDSDCPAVLAKVATAKVPEPRLLNLAPLLPTIDVSIAKRKMAIQSFTGLHKAKKREQADAFGERPDRVDEVHEPIVAANDPFRGAVFGEMVHEVFERIDFAEVEAAATESDLDIGAAGSLIGAEIARFLPRLVTRAPDEQLAERCRQLLRGMVWKALRTPLRALDGMLLCQVRQQDSIRELEFLYPHSAPSRESPVFLTGFMDLVFRWQKSIYLLDWKTNVLPSYDAAGLKAGMQEADYSLQIKLYWEALSRWLQHVAPASKVKLGGVLYLFLRGLNGTDDASGVYFLRGDELTSREDRDG